MTRVIVQQLGLFVADPGVFKLTDGGLFFQEELVVFVRYVVADSVRHLSWSGKGNSALIHVAHLRFNPVGGQVVIQLLIDLLIVMVLDGVLGTREHVISLF